jgi:hypothetical protein
MNIAQIEENVNALLADLLSGGCQQDAFIYELLLAYGHRKQSVTRLKTGERNLAKDAGEVIWKRHVYFKHVEGNDLHTEIDKLRKEKVVGRYKLRFVIVTNFDQLLAVDTKTSDSLDINLDELPKLFDFFLPWAGMEKAVYQGENPADVKAAEKMAKLFDLIKIDNFDESNRDDAEALHKLNIFLTRLLFCFFAEDTEIFTENQFSNAVNSHTKNDGSDLSGYLNRLFTVLNTADSDRVALLDAPLPQYLDNFPYVNGGLFTDDIPAPLFSAKSRRMLIECGSELDWSDINPDIFGSMIQAVVHPDQRSGMGMHYTSVTNIMKVIEPLFLNDIYEELERVESSSIKLQKLQQRLGKIKIFDPACGSGNFLIIAYKELRKMEMEVLKCLQELELGKTGQISQPFSVIKLSQFYGIELDDFAHEVAILSLWLAEHQMNVEFKTEFGACAASLPLRLSGNVVCKNAARTDWTEVCENEGEVFILGNPPYAGQRNHNDFHKEDLDIVFKGMDTYKKLDYISCWFYKASNYIVGSQSFAFVTTNSICQGIQVDNLWKKILVKDVEIFFAYKEFNWSNNAKSNAKVTCTIIGIRKKSRRKKYLYGDGFVKEAKNINAYLVDGPNVIVQKSNHQLSKLPKMQGGNQPREGGYLMLTDAEKHSIIDKDARVEAFIRPMMGSSEFIKGTPRWCIWITDDDLESAKKIPELDKRINKVRAHRESGNSVEKSFVNVPHKFVTTKGASDHQIIIPTVSSERRDYIPIGMLSSNIVVNSRAFTIFDPQPYVMTILVSKLHMIWVKAIAGRMRSDITYSSVLCYNTFPLPDLSDVQIESLNLLAMKLLSVREGYPSAALSDLYDPDSMPEDLRAVHSEIDSYVDGIFSNDRLRSDEERLAKLLEIYMKKMKGDKVA